MTTRYYSSGPNTNLVASVLQPDGTRQLYDYDRAADGSRTKTVYSGQPNSGQTAIVAGTKTVTVPGRWGRFSRGHGPRLEWGRAVGAGNGRAFFQMS